MSDRRLIGFAAGTAAAVLLVGGIGTAAYAADVRSTVEIALASLGVEASQELVDDLSDEELLDDALAEDADAGDELADESGSPEEELEESFLAWNERAELWRAAFAEVKTEFDACRATVDAEAAESDEATAPGAKGDCAVAFSGRLQVAFAETLVEFLESQQAVIDALPEDQRAEAQAELDRRLEKALTKLDRTTERVEARDAKRLEKALDKLSKGSATEGDEGDTSTTGKPEKPAGSNGNGNGGGGGKPDHAGKPAGD